MGGDRRVEAGDATVRGRVQGRVRQRVVRQDQTAVAGQGHCLLQVARITFFVCIDEDQVEGRFAGRPHRRQRHGSRAESHFDLVCNARPGQVALGDGGMTLVNLQ